MGEVPPINSPVSIEAVSGPLPLLEGLTSLRLGPGDRFIPAETAPSETPRVEIEPEGVHTELEKVLTLMGVAVAGAALITGAILLSKKVDIEAVVAGLKSFFHGAAHLHLEKVIPLLKGLVAPALATVAMALLLRESLTQSRSSDFRPMRQEPMTLFKKPTELVSSTHLPRSVSQTSSLAGPLPSASLNQTGSLVTRTTIETQPVMSYRTATAPSSALISFGQEDRSGGHVWQANKPIATWILLADRHLNDNGPFPVVSSGNRVDGDEPILSQLREAVFPFDEEVAITENTSEAEVARGTTRRETEARRSVNDDLPPLFVEARHSYLLPLRSTDRGGDLSAPLPDLPGFMSPVVPQESLLLALFPLSSPGRSLASRITRGKAITSDKDRTASAGSKSLLGLGRPRIKGIFGSSESPSGEIKPFVTFFYIPQMEPPRVSQLPLDLSQIRPRGRDYSPQLATVARVTEYELHAEEVRDDLPEIRESEETAEGQEQGGDGQDPGRNSEEEELTEVV